MQLLVLKNNLLVAKNKYFRAFTLLLVFFTNSILLAQNDWTFAVTVSAKDLESKSQLDGANIIITKKSNNARVYNAISSSLEKVKLNLEPGEDYILKITKDGYVSKNITISTKNVPVSDKTIPSYIFDVTSDIFTEEPGEDYSAFRPAFGMILYDENKKDFVWIPNEAAKQKEEELKDKRKEKRKSAGKDSDKKNAKEESQDQLDVLAAKKEKAIQKAKDREAKLLADKEYREFLRKEALASFNVDYDAPKKIYARSIANETEEGRNYNITKTIVLFEDGRKVIFRKIVFEWGGVYYKQDEYDLSDNTYNLLLKIIELKP